MLRKELTNWNIEKASDLEVDNAIHYLDQDQNAGTGEANLGGCGAAERDDTADFIIYVVLAIIAIGCFHPSTFGNGLRRL